MKRIRVEKNKNYTTISNVFLRDERLSLKAKGFLAMIMSLKDDWDFTIEGFVKITKEGESAIYTAIKELKDFGYCKEEKIRDEKKRIVGNEYTFYEEPQIQSVENQLDCENQDLGFLNQANQGQISTTNNNTNNKVLNEIKEKEDNKLSSKRKIIDFQAIIDCWNENNGKSFGNVERITDKRKRAIKHILESHGIGQETLIKFFKTLPFADNWLFNPSQDHKNWKPDFDWWIANTKNWFTKGLEGGVHKEKRDKFDMIMNGQSINQTQHECNETIININGQIYR